MKIKCTTQKQFPLWTHLYYGLLFLFLALVCMNAPLISDDFEFADLALTSPRDLLSYVLYYGNGRLMGNLTGVFLVNFPVLCAIFKAATFCGIIYLLPRVITTPWKNRTFMVALVSFVVLGANPDIMGQIFTWTSGWANFVPPILIGLFCFYVIRSQSHFSFKVASVILVLGFMGQLYVEHATALQILAAICLLLYYRKQGCKPKVSYTLCWLAAGICGAAIMFAIPKIFYLEVNRTTGYRTFHIIDFVSYVSSAVLFVLSTLEQCTALLAVFSLFGFLVNKKKSPVTILKKAIYLVVPTFLFIYPHLKFFSSIVTLAKHGSFLVYIAVLLVDVLLIKDKQKKLPIFWLCTMAVIATAPFLVITPFGERCMYLSYILLCIAALSGVEYALETTPVHTKLLQFAFHGATAVTCIILAVSLVKIHHYDRIRDAHIRQQIADGQSKVVVFHLPTRYAFNTYLLDRYYYNQQPGDVSFEAVDLNTWMQTYPQASQTVN